MELVFSSVMTDWLVTDSGGAFYLLAHGLLLLPIDRTVDTVLVLPPFLQHGLLLLQFLCRSCSPEVSSDHRLLIVVALRVRHPKATFSSEEFCSIASTRQRNLCWLSTAYCRLN